VIDKDGDVIDKDGDVIVKLSEVLEFTPLVGTQIKNHKYISMHLGME
jgi:hypothetical protein